LWQSNQILAIADPVGEAEEVERGADFVDLVLIASPLLAHDV